MVNRLRISKLVSIYITDMLSPSRDAGWEGESMLARMIIYKGFPPPPTRNDQSNLSMIIAMGKLRNKHYEFPKIAAALDEIKRECANAIIAKHWRIGLNDATGKAWTDEERAADVDQDINTFKYNLKKAYYALDTEIQKYERYEEYKPVQMVAENS